MKESYSNATDSINALIRRDDNEKLISKTLNETMHKLGQEISNYIKNEDIATLEQYGFDPNTGIYP